jgi:hypothetical protein
MKDGREGWSLFGNYVVLSARLCEALKRKAGRDGPKLRRKRRKEKGFRWMF